MAPHLLGVGVDLRKDLKGISSPGATLWQQLAPCLQEQLAKQWGRLIKQIQQNIQIEEDDDAFN